MENLAIQIPRKAGIVRHKEIINNIIEYQLPTVSSLFCKKLRNMHNHLLEIWKDFSLFKVDVKLNHANFGVMNVLAFCVYFIFSIESLQWSRKQATSSWYFSKQAFKNKYRFGRKKAKQSQIVDIQILSPRMKTIMK